MNDIIVLCPTVERATEKFKKFCENNDRYIEKAVKFQRRVTLINGVNIFFKGETEGQRGIIGTHAKIIQSDDFSMDV